MRPPVTGLVFDSFRARLRACSADVLAHSRMVSRRGARSLSPHAHSPKRQRLEKPNMSPHSQTSKARSFVQISSLKKPSPIIDERSIELNDDEKKLRTLLLDVANFIDQNPKSQDPSNKAVPDELDGERLELRFTGGWVRDKLLKLDCQDVDIAINKMTGEQFGVRLKEYLESPGIADKYGIGNSRNKAGSLSKIEANPEKSKHLETVTTRLLGLDLDLVNLRKETYTEDSRNPVMEFGTPKEDALRRDATINAMFYNLHSGKVEDLTGCGLNDLKAGKIRTPLEPHTTFKDDPLRVLRLIRFASRYGYQIVEEAQSAMQEPDIKEALLVKITKERIWMELEKTLKGSDPRPALEYIDKLELYTTIFMDPLTKSASSPRLENWHGAYDALDALIHAQEGISHYIASNLIRSDEDKFASWAIAMLLPWSDAPEPQALKNNKRALPVAAKTARDGIKAPNKVTELLTACVWHRSQIADLVGKSSQRDVLGMKIREWGPSWRLQVLHALLFDVLQNTGQQDGMYLFCRT